MRYLTMCILFFVLLGSAVPQANKQPRQKRSAAEAVVKAAKPAAGDTAVSAVQPRIIFYELGSVKCIPCRQMQPVMKAIEEKYAGQVSVVFYDVWKEEEKAYAEKFGIKLIPTQVFVDRNGKELMRHEGFFPEKEIDAFLQSQGIRPAAVRKGA